MEESETCDIDPSEHTWVLQDGCAHIYCEDATQARAIADLVRDVCGSRVEWDGEFVYCKFDLSFDEARQDAEDMGFDATEDDILAHLEEREDQACRELEELGFNVEIQA